MTEEMEMLVDLMNTSSLKKSGVIKWGCPIPSFGNLKEAKIATVGLNPSNREFVNAQGHELDGPQRRFHTLKSLGLKNWREATESHYSSILDFCFNYFNRNPYDSWFKKLDHIISGTSNSYYFPSGIACHLDLIPYATFNKWTDLDMAEKNELLELSSNILGKLLNASEIDVLILNGQTVINNFEKMSGITFEKCHQEEWDLPRKSGQPVAGFSYQANIQFLGQVSLKRPIRILGYNHNIQSSFGVTKGVQTSIRNWVTKTIIEKK